MRQFLCWSHVDRFFTAWPPVAFRPAGHLVWRKRYTARHYLGYRLDQASLLAKGTPSPPVVRAPTMPSFAAPARLRPVACLCRYTFGRVSGAELPLLSTDGWPHLFRAVSAPVKGNRAPNAATFRITLPPAVWGRPAGQPPGPGLAGRNLVNDYCSSLTPRTNRLAVRKHRTRWRTSCRKGAHAPIGPQSWFHAPSLYIAFAGWGHRRCNRWRAVLEAG